MVTRELSAAIVKAAAPRCLHPDAVAEAARSALHEIGAVRPREIAAFMGQWCHETGEFRWLEEQLSYSADGLVRTWPSRFRTPLDASPYARAPEKLGNKVYAGRLGNGDEASGDGWRFRGRGPAQLTGRTNYRAMGQALGLPLDAHPETVATWPVGFRVAALYWQRHGCDVLSTQIVNPRQSSDAYRRITTAINGAATDGPPSEHLSRCAYFEAFLSQLAPVPVPM